MQLDDDVESTMGGKDVRRIHSYQIDRDADSACIT
jgi:hypothetical protein